MEKQIPLQPERLRFVEVPLSRPQATLAQAVRDGLARSPRSLPCRFFYDEAGSVLFEQITQLPEYYPTRTERAILDAHADAILEATGAPPTERLTVIELGSGNSCKTRLLLEAAMRRHPAGAVHYVPIDISGEFLRASAETLLHEYPTLTITALAAEYRDALAALETQPLPAGPRLFLFLGGNVGNFTASEATSLLGEVRSRMRPDDRLLIGADLFKDPAILTAAYNDAAGVTEAFNKNLLVRINREMGADFRLEDWYHYAPFNPLASRIEMWLISRRNQTVTFGESGMVIPFRQGEPIHTENSHKFTRDAFTTITRRAGLTIDSHWTDVNDWFALFLAAPTAV